jgi:UDP-glucose 4-epimerase
MNIVVTGASGLLGRAFVRHASAAHEVLALHRGGQVDADGQIAKATWKRCDYSAPALRAAFADADGIVHLAATRPIAPDDAEQAANANLALDKSVFEAAQQAGVRNLVFASSRGVYGAAPTPWLEGTAVQPQTPYAQAKLDAEQVALALNEKAGMRIKALRLAQLLAADEYQGGLLRTFFDQALAGQPLTVGVAGIKREYLYLEDAASALLAALQTPQAAGVFNLGSGSTVTIEALARSIAAAVGQPELVQVQEPLQQRHEHSLMNSQRFYDTFNWQPRFTLATAVQDAIARKRDQQRG